MKIIADCAIPFLEDVLTPFAEVVRIAGKAITAADVRDADALIVRTRTRCDARLLAGSRVRMIATATIGFDHIDLGWCAAPISALNFWIFCTHRHVKDRFFVSYSHHRVGWVKIRKGGL